MSITVRDWILCRQGRLLALTITCLTLGVSAVSGVTTNVAFQNYSFTPQTVTIQAGDTVVWTNAGGFHTVTGDGTDPFCGAGQVPVSCSVTFTNAGTFPYHCNLHQALGMVGSVIVTAPTNSPTQFTIVSPVDGTVLPVPGSVTITVAVPAGADIGEVQFFDGARMIGDSKTSPF